MIFKIDTNLI